jgi:hypothetical protein
MFDELETGQKRILHAFVFCAAFLYSKPNTLPRQARVKPLERSKNLC